MHHMKTDDKFLFVFSRLLFDLSSWRVIATNYRYLYIKVPSLRELRYLTFTPAGFGGGL